jgi:hypothetical protein
LRAIGEKEAEPANKEPSLKTTWPGVFEVEIDQVDV